MTDLKPCPFCGADLVQSTLHEGPRASVWTVFCAKCDASGPVGPEHASAVKAWNKRPSAPTKES